MTLDLSLYLVTDHRLPGPLLLEVVAAAVDGGVTLVQLRDPQLSGLALYERALRLKGLLDPRGVPLIVNDRVDIAVAVDAAGAHVGQADLPPAAARRLLGRDKTLGLSITDAGQLAALDAAAVDHLGVGPVFATGTKPDAAPALGLDGLRRVVAAAPLPCVAIGGIEVGKAAAVWTTGVAGLAVVSAISASRDPAAAARALLGARGQLPGAVTPTASR